MSNAESFVASTQRITEVDLCAWIGQAAPQEAIEYHRGFLVIDTDARSSCLAAHERAELVRVARRALQACDNDLIHLVQRRRASNEFSYLAIARPRPHQMSQSLSSRMFQEAA